MALFDNEVAIAIPGKKRPWDRLPKEKEEHFAAFQDYLGSEARSIQAIAEKNGWKLSYCADLAKLYNWQGRSNAYDFHKTEQQIPEIISSKETSLQHAAEDHIALCKAAQKTAAVGFNILQKYIKEYEYAREAGEDLPPRPFLKPDELVKMAEFGIKHERLIMGEATSRAENKNISYDKLSDEELQQLQKLLEKSEEVENG